jgi:RND family efflux transporter MFP subunit
MHNESREDTREALHHRPQPWLKRAALVGVGVAALIVAVGAFTRVTANQQLKSWTAIQAIPTVDVVHASADGAPQDLMLPGQVQADYSAVIHARVSGYLKHWYVDIGAPVKAGQVLADIDTPELDQQLAQARADLATATANQKLAQVTADRWTNLLAKDAVSRQEADEKTGDLQAKTALVQAAKANVDRLAAMESFKRIVAPFDGIVTARTTDIGALIAAGAPGDAGLFAVSDEHRLRIYVKVPQAYSASIVPGSTATLRVPEYPDRTFVAKLVSTSGAVGDHSGTVLVELQMDNPGDVLKPGDYAQVQFSAPPLAGVMSLPASATMFRHRGMAVAVVGPDDHVRIKYVSIQRDLGQSVQVSGGGLSPSDRVVNNPPDSIAEGELVRIAGSAPGAGPQAKAG